MASDLIIWLSTGLAMGVAAWVVRDWARWVWPPL
jgi:hypothetical protein